MTFSSSRALTKSVVLFVVLVLELRFAILVLEGHIQFCSDCCSAFDQYIRVFSRSTSVSEDDYR